MCQVVALAAALALLCTGCGTANLNKYPKVIVPPMPDGETSTYLVSSGDQQIGFYTMTVQRVEFGQTPAFRLDLVTKTMSGNIPMLDSSAVFVTRDSMVPLSSFRFLRTGSALSTTAANYAAGSVAIASYSPQGEKQRLLPNGPFTYDSDQLTFLSRALLVPTTGKPVEIKVISAMGPPSGGGVIDGRLGIGTPETVTVPAGTFDCSRLIYNLGPHVVVMWIEKGESHRLIRYATPGGALIMELLPPGTPLPAWPPPASE